MGHIMGREKSSLKSAFNIPDMLVLKGDFFFRNPHPSDQQKQFASNYLYCPFYVMFHLPIHSHPDFILLVGL